MNTTITVTDAACAYIQKMLEKNKGAAFRLSVKKTGCSGFSYSPSVIDEIPPHDTILHVNGLSIAIDTTWLHLLEGVHVDYIEEEKSGLKQKRLVFTNPKEASRCGCGESFHIES